MIAAICEREIVAIRRLEIDRINAGIYQRGNRLKKPEKGFENRSMIQILMPVYHISIAC